MAHAHATPQPNLGIDINMLERTAEDISSAASAAGSDIGEEIRKMMERERSRSRSTSQSSHNRQPSGESNQILSSHFSSPPTRPRRIGSNRSRATSNSYANSVSDARLGITSPVESVRSVGSWSRTRIGMAMDSSMHSNAAFEPTHEPLQEGRPLDSPLAPSASIRSGASSYSQDIGGMSRRVSQSSLAFSYSQSQEHGMGMSRQASQSSFAARYDQMASQIEEQLQTIPHTPEPEQQENMQERYQQAYQQPYYQAESEQHVQQHHEQDHSRDLSEVPDRPHSTDTFREAQLAFKDFDGVHFNPDTEEFVAVDENGNEVRRVSARTSSGSLLDAARVLSTRTSSGSLLDASQVLKTPRARPMSYGAGTHLSGYGPGNSPPEGMVYYPAPVPRMLNLPKRLSQLPSASAQAKRRTLLEEMSRQPKEEPAPFIPKLDFDESEDTTRNRSISQPLPPTQEPVEPPGGMLNQRMSVANMRNIPPQLRASIYFEHPPIRHDVQVKHESAVATLDSILAASATAPVSAFVDHPFAGDVRKSVYGMEKPTHHRKNTSTALLPTESQAKELKKKRSSSIGNFFRRNSSADLLEGGRPVSRGSQILDLNDGGKKLQKRKSQLSMADALERERTLQELEGQTSPLEAPQTGLVAQAANVADTDDEPLQSHMPSAGVVDSTGKVYTEGEQIAEDFREQEALSDVSDTDPIYVQPATLLAELQVRKAQLKNRTKTAAVKYPNGMHSTLLQLDAVEQINKQKRSKQRVALAWEDAHQSALAEEVEENDDVPLGVLYPSKDGTRHKTGDPRDWNRPLGLMEQREMEDTEPLSRRAERLNPKGMYVQQRKAQQQAMHQRRVSEMQLAKELAEADQEADPLQDGETLGQRARRIKDREALGSAIEEVVPKDGSRPQSTFSADVLSQFGGLDDATEKKTPTDATPAAVEGAEEVEETLGQRRARLQKERSASGEQPQQQARPPLRSTNSMANLLSANPIGARQASAQHAGEAGAGGLLQASAIQQARQKAGLRETNAGRASTFGMGFGDAGTEQQPKRSASGLMADVRARPANGLFVPTAAAGVPGFASPTAAVAAGYAGMPGMIPGQQINPAAYYALGGQRGSMMPPMPQGMFQAPMMGYGQQQQMPMQMGMPMPYGMPQQQMGWNGSMGLGNAGMGMGGMEMPLDPGQRAAIDRWRMGIA